MATPIATREEAVQLNDEGMHDEIVIGCFVFNKDKSITASCLINVYHPDGRLWAVYRDIRIPLEEQ